MATQLFLKPGVDRDAIVAFSQAHPSRPAYSAKEARRFLDHFVSSDELIFELHDLSGLAACAVLIDKVENPSNSAFVEILGVRADVELSDMLSVLAPLVRNRLPANRSAFQITVPDDSTVDASFCSSLGVELYYSTYEMEAKPTTAHLVSRPIAQARPEEATAIYELLCDAFRQNIETGIPSFEDWSPRFMSSPDSVYYLVSEGERLVAFANLILEKASTEVRTLGVHPAARGAGYGRDLLQHCLNETFRLGLKACHLTVAIENERALGLYQRSGFLLTQKYRCYRSRMP